MTSATLLDRATATDGLRFGPATLVVRDVDAMTRFYAEEFGMNVLNREVGQVTLGADTPLLLLRHDQHARSPTENSAGLFHIAYLVPTRLDLARWSLRACANGLRLDGASDHLVSEALYLSDPEGNGIEVYADRAPDAWKWSESGVAMATKRLDMRELYASAQGECGPLPEGTVIGHMHLKVGDAEQASEFWTEALGMGITARYAPHAVFMAAGKYHHHVAVNTWHSKGASKRVAGTTGLESFVVHRDGMQGVRVDPWGNRAVLAD
jgi:catechol 2,3-dioxygenase